jgi:hypothetical protein
MSDESNVYQVSSQSIAEFRAKKEEIISKAVDKWIEVGDIEEPLLIETSKRYTTGMEFVVKNLSTAMELKDLNLLEDQIKWASVRLPHDGISHGQLIKNLVILHHVIHDCLSPDNAQQVGGYLNWMIENLKSIE